MIKKILVVEDDGATNDVLSEALKLEGYDVDSAFNGREALIYIKKTDEPCLVLLDLVMPIMDGFEFMRHLRDEHLISKVPIVVITASAKVHYMPKDAAGFIKKPINLNELFATVHRICGAPSDSTP